MKPTSGMRILSPHHWRKAPHLRCFRSAARKRQKGPLVCPLAFLRSPHFGLSLEHLDAKLYQLFRPSDTVLSSFQGGAG